MCVDIEQYLGFGARVSTQLVSAQRDTFRVDLLFLVTSLEVPHVRPSGVEEDNRTTPQKRGRRRNQPNSLKKAEMMD